MLRLSWAALAAFFIFGASVSWGRTYYPVPSTPDISVTASATAVFRWDRVPGTTVDYVYIKNDCSATLWFDLRGGTDAAARRYPIRLGQNQTFEGPFVVHAIGVSPANSGTACTFTLQGGVRRD